MKKILFICMGNICRSPTAEAVMNALIEKEALNHKILCDSAGTIGYHTGSKADSRMFVHASERGFKLTSISRQFNPEKDFKQFDYIVVMDNANYRDITSLDPKSNYTSKIFKATDFCTRTEESEVPDPYYGGAQGFEKVLDILEDACRGLLTKVREENVI